MNPRLLLEAVTAVAEREGERLAREFYLPQGPRGRHSSAPIDLEIVALGLIISSRIFFQQQPRQHPLIGISGGLDRFQVGICHSEGRLWLRRNPSPS